MKIRPLGLMLLLGAATLAGCLAPGDGVDDTDPGSPAVTGASGTSTSQPGIPQDEAVLVGQVVSDDFLPLANVTVVVQTLDVNATTNDHGQYRFEALDPGEHKVFAQAAGFGVELRPVVLEGGKATSLNFILPTLPGVEPYVQSWEQSGFIECAYGAVQVTANCLPIQFVLQIVGTNPTNTITILEWPFRVEGLQAVVVELAWQSSFPDLFAKELLLAVEDLGSGPTGGATYAQQTGGSPVRIDLFGEDLPQAAEGADEGVFQTRVFPPFEAGNVVFMQKYTVFTSLFYHQLPTPGYTGIPEGWSP